MRSDREIIRQQLGRESLNMREVVSYCPFKKPAVIKTFPYLKGRPFPTLYWLTCPYLVREVSRLEDSGLIKELSLRLRSDSLFKKNMEETHQRYARERFSLLPEKDIIKIREKNPSIIRVLKESGVGGIMKKEGIKCLHTHLADFLISGDNPAGELIDEIVDWPEECYECDNIINRGE